MDVREAQAFLAVAEELHFGRAARRLQTTQPPLSRLIQRLEEDLGVALFSRNTRRVELTATGRALVDPARKLVDLSNRIRGIVVDSESGEVGHIRLGFSGGSLSPIIAKLTQAVRRSQPGVTLELHQTGMSHLGLQQLIGGELDLVLGRWDVQVRGIESVVLGHEDVLLAVPEDHPLASRSSVHPRELHDQLWVTLNSRILNNRLNILGAKGKFVPRISREVEDPATLLLLVANGDGSALVLSGIRDNLPAQGVSFVRIAPDLGGVDVRLCWRASDSSPALLRVRELWEREFSLIPNSHE